jgi:PPM family protein phosphatase
MSLTIKTASITDKGLNARYTVNEDCHLIMNAERVFAVADGVGGAYAGEVASRTALKIIHQGIKKFSRQFNNNHIDLVQKLIIAGNEAVYKLGVEKAKQMASTIAIMSVEDTYAVLGHVGDSRIYLARDGKLLQLTKDHSKLQELLEQNPRLSLTRAEYRDGHVITRALGAEEDVEPDIQKVHLKNDDVFILCTDGIYIHNSTEEMLENLKRNKSDLKKVCEALKKNCYDRGAKDNLTAIVLRIIQNETHEGNTKRIKVR